MKNFELKEAIFFNAKASHIKIKSKHETLSCMQDFFYVKKCVVSGVHIVT